MLIGIVASTHHSYFPFSHKSKILPHGKPELQLTVTLGAGWGRRTGTATQTQEAGPLISLPTPLSAAPATSRGHGGARLG